MSQAELARRSGVPVSTINRIETGVTKLPTPEYRRKLASALGVSHLELLVQAGEITQEELGSEAGAVERNPDDPREQLIDMMRQTPMPDAYVRSLVKMLESWQEDHRRVQASRSESS